MAAQRFAGGADRHRRRRLAQGISADLRDALCAHRQWAKFFLADPQRKAAKVELDYIAKLRDIYSADVTRRHVRRGMAADGETVKAIDDAHYLGMSEDGGQYDTRAIGQ